MGGAAVRSASTLFLFSHRPVRRGRRRRHGARELDRHRGHFRRRRAAIAAHEFFHVWNVKRIRPQALEPVDYTKEQYTRALWFAEGVTNTYCSFTLERTGLWSKKQFYDDLASQISDWNPVPRTSGRARRNRASTRGLKNTTVYNAPDRSISYYNKGQILGVLLDLAIRDATDNHKSLDDVLRLMNDEYAKQGKFYNESEANSRRRRRGCRKELRGFLPPLRFRHRGNSLQCAFSARPAWSSRGRGRRRKMHDYAISEVAHPTERQRRILAGFLRGRTD